MSEPLPPAAAESPRAPLEEGGAAPRNPVQPVLASARGGLRSALRGIAWSLALGLCCTALFALAARPAVAPLSWIALHLASSSAARSVLSISLLGTLQAALCFAALGLVSLAGELPPAVGAGAGLFAAALPGAVLWASRGAGALMPAPLLVARLLALALSGFSGWVAVLLARRWVARRSRAHR